MEPFNSEFEKMRGLTPFIEGVEHEEDNTYLYIKSKNFNTPIGEGFLRASKIKRLEEVELDFNKPDIGVGLDEKGVVFVETASNLASKGYNTIDFFLDNPLIGSDFRHSMFRVNIWIPGTQFDASNLLDRETDLSEEDSMVAVFKSLDKNNNSTVFYFLKDEQLSGLNFNISSVPQGGEN